jgi:hypothetical protein
MLKLTAASVVIGALGLLVALIVDWDELRDGVREFAGSPDPTADASPPLGTTTPGETTAIDASTATSAVRTDAEVQLVPLTGNLSDASGSDLYALFTFIHSGLCLATDGLDGITQELCESDPAVGSRQLWQLSADSSSTSLRQGDLCLQVQAETEELDPMGNTWGVLGLGDCDPESSTWQLAYSPDRDAFQVTSEDRSRCLDVLGGKSWTGQPVVAYPCIDFDNQYVNVRVGAVP